ncbi:MAG: hypothetical protein Q4P08_06770 [Eubacteriales bacterium]|nr:hypothetical protein [Eubacteriales bacterium]
MKKRSLSFYLLTVVIGGFFLFAYWYLMTEYFARDIFSFPWLILTLYFVLCLLAFSYAEKRVSAFISEQKALDIFATARLSLIFAFIFAPFVFIISKLKGE